MPRSLRNTNANLLVALDALLTEQNVTRAAERVGVTQSSMSANLAQLRTLFDDPLLVRAGRSMQPTPLAERLRDDLRRGVDAFDAVLAGGVFDPETSAESFVLALSDRVEMVLFPLLLERLRRVAPQVTVQVMPWGSLRPPRELATGDVDISAGVSLANAKPLDGWGGGPPKLARGHHHAALYDSGLVSIMRRDHPRASDELSLDVFCALDHVLVTEGLGDTGVVDHVLSKLGAKRRIAARVPRHTLVGELIARTDLIATIDRRVAESHASRYGLRLCQTPVELPSGHMTMIWHDRTHTDPAREWLRAQILDVASSVT